jgi:Lon protease-like protein
MSDQELPLFPLHSVLFPDGPVSLRIFETRYLDMVSRCLKEDIGFGVVLIREGRETGPAQVEDIGTVARIRDWDRLEDGLLGVVATGGRRFRLNSVRRQDDGLNLGRVEWIEEAPVSAVPPNLRHLAEIVVQVLPNLPAAWQLIDTRPEDAAWVGYRLAELLPVNLAEKQRLLEMEDPVGRLAEINRYFQRQPSG